MSATRASEPLFLCSCLDSMAPDAARLSELTGRPCLTGRHLCRSEVGRLEAALAEGPVTMACLQEMPVFEELDGAEGLSCLDLRDRAGWSEEAAQATPKMAALIADAGVLADPAPVMPISSEGVCLVIGPAAAALPAAEKLADQLSVTVMLTDDEEVIPPLRDRYEILRGEIRGATGRLGAFEIRADRVRAAEPAGRGPLAFGTPSDGGRSACDIILDLTGGTPLFPAPEKRDGYLRADPRQPGAVGDRLLEAVQMVGEFEKPLYVRTTESLCAHSRAGQEGCTRCLPLCPTGALVPQGDHVHLAADICAGCGACAAVCPTGALAYDDPGTDHQVRRMRVMAEAYRNAGGTAPRLLLHDADHGTQVIAMSARFGRGLPADVLPQALPGTGGVGHVLLTAALAQGYAEVLVLTGPKAELPPLEAQLGIARALVPEPERIRHLDLADPDALEAALYDIRPAAPATEAALLLGEGRPLVRSAVQALGITEPRPLPEGAPYGRVEVNESACTLCLSCASLCPTGALGDNPDRPELRFQEDACVQCGICERACPEDAITLKPGFDPRPAALSFRVLKSEDPFACISCGKEFGVRSTIERIMEKLGGTHSMFTNSDNLRLIQMCDDCRVAAQFSDGPRRRTGPVTTDDYLSGRRGPGRGDA